MLDKLLGRGVIEIISEAGLKNKLSSGRKLRVKLGVDPSRPDLHLGHAVALWQLKKFQEAGHRVIFLIGDYTAMVGDPSGKNKTRPVLTEREIKENAKTYLRQVGKILDIKKVEVRRNSEWFRKMNMADLIRLGSKFSVAGIIERDDFEKRLKGGNEISMHELFYPMMQAYDSVALNADIEMGGTDQKFNILAARELQKKMGQNPQDIILTELLVGVDGKEKMSKSLNNYIGITEPAKEQFGKTMSIPDDLILTFFKLCTDVSDEKIEKYENEMKSGRNPKQAKEELAFQIVKLYHSQDEAEKAKSDFIRQFSRGELPDKMNEIDLSGNFGPILLLQNLGVVSSNSEARRLVEQGALKIDGTKITDPNATISLASGMIIRVGKLKYWKIK